MATLYLVLLGLCAWVMLAFTFTICTVGVAKIMSIRRRKQLPLRFLFVGTRMPCQWCGSAISAGPSTVQKPSHCPINSEAAFLEQFPKRPEGEAAFRVEPEGRDETMMLAWRAP